MLGCINALNLIDGMDGLASIVGLSTAAMMSIIAMSMGNNHVAVIAVVLAGAIGGFLVYNLPPASIFLGDSGSAVIGLALGILGIQGAMKTSTTLSITAPAVIMTLPMFDVVMAVVRRKLTGRRFDAADRQHIHHRLLDRGLSPGRCYASSAPFCLTTGAAATAATVFRWDALAWIAALTLIVLAIRLRLFGHYEFALLKGALDRPIARLAPAAWPEQPTQRAGRKQIPTPWKFLPTKIGARRPEHGPRRDSIWTLASSTPTSGTACRGCSNRWPPRAIGLAMRLLLVDNPRPRASSAGRASFAADASAAEFQPAELRRQFATALSRPPRPVMCCF